MPFGTYRTKKLSSILFKYGGFFMPGCMGEQQSKTATSLKSISKAERRSTPDEQNPEGYTQ